METTYIQRKRAYTKKWQKTNIDKVNAKRREKYKNSPETREKIRILKRKEYYRNREHYLKKVRNLTLKRKFGITQADYDRMNTEQKGLCKICGRIDPENRSLAVDHNHNTKKVRGLLCSHHNRGLGLFEDSITMLESAIRYLKENQ